jgi:hypothetical protein
MGFNPLDILKRFFQDVHRTQRESLVALTCVELRELENIFALLLLGSFAGFSAPPTFLSLELLPFMERELRVMNRQADNSGDMRAELMGTLGID